MIEFTSTQLSWILVGACGIGGTGYLTIDSKMAAVGTNIAVIQTKAELSDKKLSEMATQLSRVEQLLLDQNSKRGSK
jgi:hypothetical protein